MIWLSWFIVKNIMTQIFTNHRQIDIRMIYLKVVTTYPKTVQYPDLDTSTDRTLPASRWWAVCTWTYRRCRRRWWRVFPWWWREQQSSHSSSHLFEISVWYSAPQGLWSISRRRWRLQSESTGVCETGSKLRRPSWQLVNSFALRVY